MTCDSQLRWISAAHTDIGPVRSRNEDAWLAQPERGLWAVADGMGGHAFGEVASNKVTNALANMAAPQDIAQFVAAASDRISRVNHELRAEAAARNVAVMGSTVAIMLACGPDIACLWAGDSRIYLYRKGRLQQLTRDHSQAQELRSRGSAGDGALPVSTANNVITRAVGATDVLELELARLEASDGDMFLLCSDGLSNAVDEPAVMEALAPGDCARASQSLVGQALANGGRDNITVVVVRADDVFADKTVANPAL